MDWCTLPIGPMRTFGSLLLGARGWMTTLRRPKKRPHPLHFWEWARALELGLALALAPAPASSLPARAMAFAVVLDTRHGVSTLALVKISTP